MTSPDDLLTRDEAADRLRISVRGLDRLRAAEVIATHRVGGRRLIRASSIDEYLAAQAKAS